MSSESVAGVTAVGGVHCPLSGHCEQHITGDEAPLRWRRTVSVATAE
jgi:hypothetical protein